MPDISVVIPTFNRGNLVCEAVESVLDQQTRRSLEVIVVDDGSTDDTEKLLLKYSGRIRYLKQSNRGVNAARNAGIRAAIGEYIALLDSDDIWLPFKVELQLEVIERIPEAGFVFSDFYIWQGDRRESNGLKTWVVDDKDIERAIKKSLNGGELGLDAPWHDLRILLSDIYELSLFRPVVLPSTSILKREVFNLLGFFPEDNWMCGDWEYFARASKQLSSIYLDVETTLNRSHDDGVRLMRRDLSDRTKLRLESLRRLWKSDEPFMNEHGSEVIRVEAKELVTLFKEACSEGRMKDAKGYLREIHDVIQRRQLKWILWFTVMSVSPCRRVVNHLRGGR